MFVKNFVDVCQANFGVAHELTTLYAIGSPANVPFYLLNEKVVKITNENGSLWLYI